MAYPTTVNDQITDSVTQDGLSVQGNSPALVLAALNNAFVQSLALSLQNAVTAQQQTSILSQAAIAAAMQKLLERGGA